MHRTCRLLSTLSGGKRPGVSRKRRRKSVPKGETRGSAREQFQSRVSDMYDLHYTFPVFLFRWFVGSSFGRRNKIQTLVKAPLFPSDTQPPCHFLHDSPVQGISSPTMQDSMDEVPPPSFVLPQLRKDYRMAAISQFVNTFKPHIGLEFDILVSRSFPCFSPSSMDREGEPAPVETSTTHEGEPPQFDPVSLDRVPSSTSRPEARNIVTDRLPLPCLSPRSWNNTSLILSLPPLHPPSRLFSENC